MIIMRMDKYDLSFNGGLDGKERHNTMQNGSETPRSGVDWRWCF